ncbi:LOW QUALITY PROTEIN: Hypothetical protein PHPALM_37000 [Phytophthora palmivora]|uniref:Uncharacterized protein n=1 Tax=Phytophthora palmivora TaxID=4796 RepID=A0A2P4WYI2_9STRA|nr:LOW QUALITY PROTEIN: Hypothetical protein PHPALM_37000 [Phytophthora palmivora]
MVVLRIGGFRIAVEHNLPDRCTHVKTFLSATSPVGGGITSFCTDPTIRRGFTGSQMHFRSACLVIYHPNVELYMDSSSQGLAVLDPAFNKFIQVQFNSDEDIIMDVSTSPENPFSINVREHLCMALALWTWGPIWYELSSGRMIYVKCWSDKMSAVQWCNRLHSNNTFSQEFNREVGLAEVYFNLRVSTSHLPGSTNRHEPGQNLLGYARLTFLCLGSSRTSSVTETLHELFSNLQAKSLATSSTVKYADTGRGGVNCYTFRNGFQQTENNIHTNSLCSLHTNFVWNNSNTANFASTVLVMLSHISWYHWRFCGYRVGLTPGHHLAIIGMHGEEPPATPKLPVTVQFLKKLHKFLNFDSTQQRVIWGASVLGFFFFFDEIRVFGGRSKGETIRNLKDRQQLLLNRVEKVEIRFLGSKIDQFVNGTTRIMARSGLNSAAPEREAQERFDSHSLRSGGSTVLFNACFDSLVVKLFGRWKSNAVERYTRMDSRLTSRMTEICVFKGVPPRHTLAAEALQ